jgi:acetolactate synthase-1/3 small subunit
MTIVVKGDEYILDQIQKQLSKLQEVISIKKCEKKSSCQREMALVKVKAEGANRAIIIETCDIFRAHIVDVGINSVIVEATGSEEKIESLIRLLEPYGILEYVKTGLTAMDRGSEVMK